MAEMTKTIAFRCSDGGVIALEETAAVGSKLLRHMIEDDCASGEIHIPNIASSIFSKAAEYMKKHRAAAKDEGSSSSSSSNNIGRGEEDLKSWDVEFMKGIDQETLFDLFMAANYLDIEGLLGLCAQTVADMIRGKSPEEIRRILNIANDFTPEEEAEVRRKNQWAFDD